jgi:O-antigen ligase
LAFIFLAFLAVNSYTNGSLLNRYAGETKATLSGDKEKTISSISNSRFDIMMSDLEMWSDNFIFGVGPGQSIPLRVHYGFSKKIAPHFEFSRLLSEHGIFGLIIILILLNHSFNLIRKKNIYPNIHLYLIFSLIFAILYISHSATRLLIPSLLLGISFLNIKSNKNKLKSNLYDTKTN